MFSENFFQKNLVSFFILALFCLLLYGQTVNSSYNLIDETEYLKISSPALDYFNKYGEKAQEFDSFWSFQKKYLEHARFKVIGVSIQWFTAKLFGTHPYALKIGVLLITLFSCFGFYLVLQKLRIFMLGSIIGAILLMTGYFSEIWYRTGPYEALGFLFFIYSIYAYQIYLITHKKTYQILSFIFLFLSIHCKETFWVLLPCFALIMVGLSSFYENLNWKAAFFKTKKDLFIIGILFLIVFTGLVYMYFKNHGLYGFQSNHRVYLILINNVQQMMQNSFFFIPCLLVFVFLPLKKYHFFFLSLLVLWYGSQLFINVHNWINPCTRYLFPGQVIAIFLAILSWHHLILWKKKWNYFLLPFFLFILIIQGKNSFSHASYFGARSALIEQIFNHIQKKNFDQVTLILEPTNGNEMIIASQVYLSFLGYNKPIKHQFIYTKNGALPEEKRAYYFDLLKNAKNPATILKEIAEKKEINTFYLFLNPMEDLKINTESIDSVANKKIFETNFIQFSASNIFSRKSVKDKIQILTIENG